MFCLHDLLLATALYRYDAKGQPRLIESMLLQLQFIWSKRLYWKLCLFMKFWHKTSENSKFGEESGVYCISALAKTSLRVTCLGVIGNLQGWTHKLVWCKFFNNFILCFIYMFTLLQILQACDFIHV